MCCSRRPRDKNSIRGKSKKHSNTCWGNPEEVDGWTEGKDNIGFKNKNKKKTTTNVNGSSKRNNRGGKVYAQ